jgi:hypothetical protein
MDKPNWDGIAAKRVRALFLRDELGKAVRDWIASNPSSLAPFEAAKVPDENGVLVDGVVWKMDKVGVPPVLLSVLLGELIHCLRSTLDHVMYQLVWIHTKKRSDDRDLYFPIMGSDKDYQDRRKKMESDDMLSADMLNFLDTFQPYKGGNHRLWQLNKLNNIYKHRALVVVATQPATEATALRYFEEQQQQVAQLPADTAHRIYIEKLALRFEQHGFWKLIPKIGPLQSGDVMDRMPLTWADKDNNAQYFSVTAVGVYEKNVVEYEMYHEFAQALTEAAFDVVNGFGCKPWPWP